MDTATTPALDVRATVVDDVVRLVGELVLTRNELLGRVGRDADPALTQAVARLDRLTSRLREGAAELRSRPLAQVCTGLETDLAARHGRGVTVTVSGGEVEVDTTHAAAVRQHLGATADWLLSASPAPQAVQVSGRRTGGHVVVEVSASGNRPATPHPAAPVPTAGWAVDVDRDDEPGRTTVRLSLAATTTIVPALVVAVAGLRYALPTESVVQIVAVGADRDRLERVASAPVLRVQGQLVPVVRLSAGAAGTDADIGLVVVLGSRGRRCALAVDRALGAEEVVSGGLPPALADDRRYAGAAVGADGGVTLVLDVAALVGLAAGTDAASAEPVDRPADVEAADHERVAVLAVEVGDRRFAVPLSAVQHVVRVPPDRVDRVGTRDVVRVAGRLLPLTGLAGLAAAEHPEGPLVLVLGEDGQSVAVAVDRVLDVVEHPAGTQLSALGDTTLAGATVLQDRVTALLDVRAALLAADATRPLGRWDAPSRPHLELVPR